MKVSTRGRYALRLMIDLAHHRNEGYVSLKEISARQDITVRYLEQIIAILLKAGFVQSFRGKAGGYRLSRHPREYTTEEILKLTEGSLLPISCTAPHENPCPRAAGCATLPFWRGLQQVIENYLRRVTAEGNRLRLRSRHLISGRGPEHFSTFSHSGPCPVFFTRSLTWAFLFIIYFLVFR